MNVFRQIVIVIIIGIVLKGSALARTVCDHSSHCSRKTDMTQITRKQHSAEMPKPTHSCPMQNKCRCLGNHSTSPIIAVPQFNILMNEEFQGIFEDISLYNNFIKIPKAPPPDI